MVANLLKPISGGAKAYEDEKKNLGAAINEYDQAVPDLTAASKNSHCNWRVIWRSFKDGEKESWESSQKNEFSGFVDPSGLGNQLWRVISSTKCPHPTAIVAYFFCRSGVTGLTKIRDIISTLAYQCIQGDEVAHSTLDAKPSTWKVNSELDF